MTYDLQRYRYKERLVCEPHIERGTMANRRKWLIKNFILVLSFVLAGSTTGNAQSQVATTTVQGVVYRADGTAATGTLIVSWPAFSTASWCSLVS